MICGGLCAEAREVTHTTSAATTKRRFIGREYSKRSRRRCRQIGNTRVIPSHYRAEPALLKAQDHGAAALPEFVDYRLRGWRIERRIGHAEACAEVLGKQFDGGAIALGI